MERAANSELLVSPPPNPSGPTHPNGAAPRGHGASVGGARDFFSAATESSDPLPALSLGRKEGQCTRPG